MRTDKELPPDKSGTDTGHTGRDVWGERSPHPEEHSKCHKYNLHTCKPDPTRCYMQRMPRCRTPAALGIMNHAEGPRLAPWGTTTVPFRARAPPIRVVATGACRVYSRLVHLCMHAGGNVYGYGIVSLCRSRRDALQRASESARCNSSCRSVSASHGPMHWLLGAGVFVGQCNTKSAQD